MLSPSRWWAAASLVILPLPLAGQWYHNTTKDAITDEVTWYIATFAKNSSASVWLRFSCDTTEGLSMFVNVDHYLSGDDVQVQYRFDSDPASLPQIWPLSRARQGAFAPDEVVLGLAARARTGRKLVIRVDEETYTFALDKTQYQKDPHVLLPDTLTFTTAYELLPCRTLRPPTVSVEADVASGIVPSADQVYLEAVVEERPDHLSGPELQYPELLKQAGVQGRVLVQAVIDTTGRAVPSSVKILQSAHAGFDGPARNYVLQSLFRPGRVGGRAVKTLVTLPIDFALGSRQAARSDVLPATLNGMLLPPDCLVGQFTVRLSVEADGRVSKVEVEPLPTDVGCRRQLIARMREARFTPARTREGRPIASVYSLTLTR